MESNKFLGLVKFFGNTDYLDSLINGCFHCTPPEVYRLHKQEGISDKYESCMFSYREIRDDSPIVIRGGIADIKDVTGVTIHKEVEMDAWMHCWFTLRLPKDQEALDKLKVDVAKMKEQFGHDYAFLPAQNLKPLVAKLQELSEKQMLCGEVAYSGDRSKWGVS